MFASAQAGARNLADIQAMERTPLDVRLPSSNLYDLVQRAASLHGSRAFLIHRPVCSGNGRWEEISFAECARQVTRAANLFHRVAGGKPVRVCHLLPNVPEALYAIWGAASVGVVTGINPSLAPEHIAAIIRASGSRILVAPTQALDEALWPTLPAICVAAGVEALIVAGPGRPASSLPMVHFAEACAGVPGDRLAVEPPQAEADAACFHTGGTTGVPKLVRHTHRNQLLNAVLCVELMAASPRDRYFLGLPLFHVNATIGTCLAALTAGASVVVGGPRGFRDKAVVADFWTTVTMWGITIVSLVPTVLAALLERSTARHDVRSLRAVACGGAPLPTALHESVKSRIGIPVIEAYGMTETTCGVTCNPLHGEHRPGSIGLRFPYHDIRVARLDAHGNVGDECGIGEAGVLLIRGPCVTPGYVDAKMNSGAFTADGRLITGDLGRFDSDGYLWLTGRAKDLIIRGGHNIDPLLIEEPLNRHPAVRLAAAVGKPDAYAGERPTAFVSLKAERHISPEALLEYCRQQVSEPAAVPDEIAILPELPMTAVGKVDKLALRALAAERVLQQGIAELPRRQGLEISGQVLHDPAHGLHARVSLSGGTPASRDELESELRAVVGAFHWSYTIVRPASDSVGGKS